MTRVLLIILISYLIPVKLLSQQLPESIQKKVEGFIEQSNKHIQEGNKNQAANLFNKIAMIYWQNKMHREAISYYQKSIDVNKSIGNTNALRYLYDNIASIYIDVEDYGEALGAFNESLQLKKQTGNQRDISFAHINIAKAYKYQGKYTESIRHFEKALEIAQTLNQMQIIKNCYGELSEIHGLLGNQEKRDEYFKLYASFDKHIKEQQARKLKSQVKQAEREKQVKEYELRKRSEELETTKDSLEKAALLNKQNQLQIQLLNQDKEIKELTIKEKEAQLKHERLIRLVLLGGLVIVALFVLVLIYLLRMRKKTNKLLHEQNLKIANQKQAIEDSITYAQRIQGASLPPSKTIRSIFPEHFIFYRPRNIVSGDFYWMTQKGNKIVTVVADCTGHGVPGAFMSMFGIAFLNEIVNKISTNKHIDALQSDDILNQLRDKVKQSLHQEDEDSSWIGIDLGLIVIDTENRTLQFSGAYNPLLVIRDEQIIERKGDKMPIGMHRKAYLSFSKTSLDLMENDIVYLFTDGFADQFGGNKGRKYLKKNLKNYLREISSLPMAEQKVLLEEEYDTWRDSYEQVDDILVCGFRITKDIGIKAEKESIDWNDKHILIVEDVEENYFLLASVLSATQAQITRAESGKEALDIIKSGNNIDLILMDIMMPEMDGYETTRKIREMNQHVPIIAQTAHHYENSEEKSLEAGCNDFITKPIDMKSFMKVVSKYLNEKH